jgi:beta-lactamase regulating signal transducer with metallopeptidase domain
MNLAAPEGRLAPLLEGAGWFMVHYLWIGAVVWMGALAARLALRRAAPEIRYLLAASSLALLVAVTFTAALAALAWRPADLRGAASLPWAGWLRETLLIAAPLVWCAGAAVLGLAIVGGVAGAWRLRRNNQALEGPIPACCRRWADNLRIDQPVTVAITPAIRSPLVAGIVRPVILLPAAALEWPAAAVELIVLHELLHVRRYDNLVTLLQRAVEAALWFHPAVWSVSRWVDDEREHCCDDLVLSLTGRQEAYAETLIRLAGDGRARRAAFSTFGRDPVAVRLRRILFREELTMSRPWELAALALAGLVAYLCLDAPRAPAGEPSAVVVPAPVPALTDGPSEPAPAPSAPAADTPPTEATPADALPPPASRPAPQTRKFGLDPFSLAGNGKPSWGPEQAAGEPDSPQAGDQVTAWASLSADDADEWLVCEYANAVTAKSIAVHENLAPGALTKITAFDPSGAEVIAWEGQDPTPRDQPRGISVIPVRLDFPVRRIKLYLDSRAVPGWNEIDAVGLEDDAGQTQWALGVEASSTYGQSFAVAPAAAAVSAKRNWGPEQAEGEPDTLVAGDQVTAWASASQDSQDEWLVCEYEAAQQPAEIVVHETYNPGAVVKITAFDEAGVETIAWEGEDPTPRDQPMGISVFPVRLETPTKKIKVYLNSVAVPGWNEIDAVGLRDVSGETQWAVHVEASTTYAQQTPLVVEPVYVPAERLMQIEQDLAQLKEQVAELARLREEIAELKKLLAEQVKP